MCCRSHAKRAVGPKAALSSDERTDECGRTSEDSLDFEGGSGRDTGGWGKFASDPLEPRKRSAEAVEQFLESSAGASGAAGLEDGLAASQDAAHAENEPTLTARIISTCNQLEEEPWLPVRSIITMFRISVVCGDKTWELLRRYTEFHELDAQLAKVFDPAVLPPLPPKLLVNEDAAIATRFLELDAYIRALLTNPNIRRNTKLHDFLGVEKHGARYGVRRYEYDSAQSEGNRYIRDNDL